MYSQIWGQVLICAHKKKPLQRSSFLIRVESEGFEPSSKRRVFKLSTCLVRWLVFDMRPDKNTQRAYLGFLVSCCGKTIGNTNPMGWTSERWTERVAVHQKYLSGLLYFSRIKPTNIQLIKQQVRMTCCHLLFVAFDLRGTLQASACWHLTTAIAVKSNVDPKERLCKGSSINSKSWLFCEIFVNYVGDVTH